MERFNFIISSVGLRYDIPELKKEVVFQPYNGFSSDAYPSTRRATGLACFKPITGSVRAATKNAGRAVRNGFQAHNGFSSDQRARFQRVFRPGVSSPQRVQFGPPPISNIRVPSELFQAQTGLVRTRQPDYVIPNDTMFQAHNGFSSDPPTNGWLHASYEHFYLFVSVDPQYHSNNRGLTETYRV